MGFSLIITGMLFLLGLDIGVIDILPDFVGYILIIKGLSMVSKINSDFESSAKYFKWCLCTSIVKLPFYLMALSMSKSDTFITLLCIFIGGLLDAYFAYNAFNSLFNGFISSTPHDDNSSKYKFALFNNFERIRLFTLVFVILKPALYIAPELTKIDNSEYGEVTLNGIVGLYRFYNLFVVLAAIISLTIGIIWYVKIRKYLKGISADKVYIDLLESKYNAEFLGDTLKHQSFYLLRVFSLLFLAFVFMLKFQLDGINYIPPFVFPVLVFAASFFMNNTTEGGCKKIKQLALVNTIVSLVYWIYNIIFVNSFIIIDQNDYGMTLSYAEQLDMMINSDFDTLYGFIGLCVLSLISSVLGIVLAKALFDKIMDIAKTHAFNHFDEKYDILTSSSDTFENESNRSNLRLFKSTKILCYVVIAFEFISTALTTLYPQAIQFMLKNIPTGTKSLKIFKSVLTNLTPSLWTIDFLLRVIFVICACIMISRIREAYKTRNYLE